MADIFELFKKIGSSNSSGRREPISYIVAGLGNPGKQYYDTRHNAGFIFMDYLSEKLGVKIDRSKFSSLVSEADISGKRVLLMKPQTYMNKSGEAIRDAAEFYKIAPENIIIVYDDVSLSPGVMRIRLKGSDGGHNGIKSIIYQLESNTFPRIKLGVGAPPEGAEMVNWVLGSIPKADRDAFRVCVENSVSAIELIISGDSQKAMNLYN